MAILLPFIRTLSTASHELTNVEILLVKGEWGVSNYFPVGMVLYLDYVKCFVIGSYVLLLVMLGDIKLVEGFDFGV